MVKNLVVHDYVNYENILPITTANVRKFEAVVVIPEIGKKQNKSNRRNPVFILNVVLAKHETSKSKQESRSIQEIAKMFKN